ncbi:MAG: Nif11-like leader peptide family natural product precursor [Eggerthellaceae bacterium]|nr:Nif11-like leader peptide family natural product precursor [Eggerthellaceae bacterium]
MNFNDLSPELREKAMACKSREEFEALCKEEGFEITDELIEGVAGGVACPIHGCDELNDTCRELCVIL